MKNHVTYNFKNNRIRVINGDKGELEKICLLDVCRVLDHIDMIENGEAIRLCPSSIKLKIRKNWPEIWFIDTVDIHSLLNKISKENKAMAGLCEELEKLFGNLPKLQKTKPKPFTNEEKEKPVVFKFKGSHITFCVVNNVILVSATEMTRAFGKTPKDYLQLVSTRKFRQSLIDKGEYSDLESQYMTFKKWTWFDERLAEHLANYLSPDKELWEWIAEKIDELKERGYNDLEIVNSTTNSNTSRKNPTIPNPNKDTLELAYNQIVKEIVPSGFTLPDTYSGVLKLASQLMEKVEEQNGIIAENQHKVAFYDHFIDNREYFRTSTIADELDISINQLNRFLVEEKIIQYISKIKQYAVTSKYKNSGLQCEIPYMWTNKRGKTYACGFRLRWTHEGREFILKLWNSRNPGQKLLL